MRAMWLTNYGVMLTNEQARGYRDDDWVRPQGAYEPSLQSAREPADRERENDGFAEPESQEVGECHGTDCRRDPE